MRHASALAVLLVLAGALAARADVAVPGITSVPADYIVLNAGDDPRWVFYTQDITRRDQVAPVESGKPMWMGGSHGVSVVAVPRAQATRPQVRADLEGRPRTFATLWGQHRVHEEGAPARVRLLVRAELDPDPIAGHAGPWVSLRLVTEEHLDAEGKVLRRIEHPREAEQTPRGHRAPVGTAPTPLSALALVALALVAFLRWRRAEA
jgi:hypothetical protein